MVVSMKESHLNQRHETFDTTNPQIKGPMVLPPLMNIIYTDIKFARS